MRYARVSHQGSEHWAALVEDTVHLLDDPPYAGGAIASSVGLADVSLRVPVTPSKIFCVGRNYADHRTEMGYAHDGSPSIFMKGPTTLIGPGESIVLPPTRLSNHVEHEAELAFVIGKPARFVDAAEAMQYVFGYTCANDVSARDLQRSDPQLTRGKGFDTFCPVGPWIETDVDPLVGTRLQCSVNGQLRQDASTSAMTYDIPFLIEYLSGFATLLPGDLVLTGSPGGTGALHAGDIIEINIAGIGTLVNHVRWSTGASASAQ